VATLFRSLVRHEYDAGALHGDMDQRARMAMLENFRKGNLKLLVASDVAARGLDIPDVSHVFNFDIPTHADDYVHRIGRTGRAGRKGAAFTLITKADRKYMDSIEKLIGQDVEWLDGDLSTLQVEEGTDEHKRGRGAKRDSKKDAAGDDRKPSGRKSRKDEIKSENAERKAKQDKPELRPEPRKEQRRHQREEDTTVGFGEDVPAFMKIPVRT